MSHTFSAIFEISQPGPLSFSSMREMAQPLQPGSYVKKKLLLVDDEETTLVAYRKLLSSSSIELDTAASMEEATSYLERQIYNIVISDLRLTGTLNLEGFDIARLARAKNPDTEIILITAYGTPEIKRQAVDLGVAQYLEKPILSSDLRNAIMSLGVEL